MKEQFAKDVKEGLSKTKKSLLSKYFYDEKGSAIFSEIMKLPEYYLTDAELEIFQNQAEKITEILGVNPNIHFDLIELGAGDGFKTIELLKSLDKSNFKYRFIPIDISQKALDQIGTAIHQQLPGKELFPKKGDYFQILGELKQSIFPKIVLFLGSNIGNMDDALANSFLVNLSKSLSKGEKLILGVDLKKSKEIVLPAYNDRQGLTSAFNLNLLERINRELDANFDISLFEHIPVYNEKEGIAKSSIGSKKAQKSYIKAIDLEISFEKGERIHTEISRKYDDEIIERICNNTGFKIIGKLTDHRDYFADYIFEKQ